MKKSYLIAALFLTTASLFAQQPKSLELPFLNLHPEIDGDLTDSCWQQLAPLAEFTTAYPVFGTSPHCQTECRIFYTQTDLYFAARCFDPDDGGIRRDAGIRDGNATGDWLKVSLDTWNDDQLAFNFTVTAAGVQLDDRQAGATWDAIWKSAVRQFAGGWTVEMRIPFTALRFPPKAEHTWGAQITRFDRSTGEMSTWSPQNPLVQDQVLQFGTLTGIRDIHQLRRASLALHSEQTVDAQTSPFDFTYAYQTIGIDGKVGLNSSTTLDVTLLPPQTFYKNLWACCNTPIEKIRPFPLPEPRQFLAEEGNLFNNYSNVNYYPSLHATSFLWRWPLETGQFFVQSIDGKVLQASKLSTRTRGNWRFGVYNALIGPTKVKINELGTPELKTETLQSVSDYLFVTSQYLLPNNSYVQLSNAALFAGQDATDVRPELKFRLRDRSNSLEVAGRTAFPYRHWGVQKSLDYNWNLSIARINRRWGWSLSHQEDDRPIIQENIPYSGNRFVVSSAYVHYRDFTPRGPFLNLQGSAGMFVYSQDHSIEQRSYRINGYVLALDRHFRSYSFTLNVVPYWRKIRYAQTGVEIFQKISPEIGGGFGFQTDNRKRLQLGAQVYGSSGVQGEFPKLDITLQPGWVLGRKLQLNLRLQNEIHFQTLKVLSTQGGRWVFEQSDQMNTRAELGVHWYPADRLQLAFSAGVSEISKLRQRAVELLDGGTLVPANANLAKEHRDWSPVVQLGGSYVFSSISQVRLTLDYVQHDPFLLVPSLSSTFDPRTRANLSFVWFIDGSKYR